MSTFVGGSSCQSDESVSLTSASSSLIPTEELSTTKGLPAVNIRQYVGVSDMRKIVNALTKALRVGTTKRTIPGF